jgi:predicted deacetylase
MTNQPAHLSIHDVCPETLGRVGDVLEVLQQLGHDRAMLLVIPGKAWEPHQVDQLRRWQDAGHVLAGHGWVHQVEKRKTLYHKLHGALLSKNVAEHLALDAEGIKGLIQRCSDWFADNGFVRPDHYVPPAWAMGRIRLADLRGLPFKTYETFRGVYGTESDRFVPKCLTGYEADTWLRAAGCRAFNAWNSWRAGVGRPLRISLHPYDLELKLKPDLMRHCGRVSSTPFVTVADEKTV